MTGLLAFVAAGLVMIALVWLRGRLDPGERERRELRGLEVAVWQRFALFEALGIRVQDLAGLPTAERLRHWTVAWRASAQVMLMVVLTAGAFALGWPIWVPVACGIIFTVAVCLVGEYVAFDTNPLASKWRYSSVWPWLMVGTLVKGAGASAGLAGLWLGAGLIEAEQFLGAALAVGAGAAAIDLCHVPARLIESRLRTHTQAVFADDATYSSILYLRSFDDDTARLYAPVANVGWYAPLLPRRVRFEELVEAWTIGQADQVVAIGRPGERRPVLGAQRTYWTDETWQDAVRRTAARCRAIIMVAGTSEGLSWEINELARMGVLGKTLLLLPPDTPEDSWLRYVRITQATDRVVPNLKDDIHVLTTMPALGYTPEGDLVHYISSGRDWASYVLAETHLLNTIAGRGSFDAAGNLSRVFALTDDPVMQARYAVTQLADPARARSLLEAAWSMEPPPSDAERDRLLVASAATVLAEHGDRARARAILLEVAEEESAGAGELVRLACDRLDDPSTTTATLFELVVPDEWQVGEAPRIEKAPPRVQVAYQRWWLKAAAHLADDEYDEALDALRAVRELGIDAGLELVSAAADALTARVLYELDRFDEARGLAMEVIDRDLPRQLKVGHRTTTAVEVRDDAAGVVLAILDRSDDYETQRIELLERQRSWKLDAGQRYGAAQVAVEIAETKGVVDPDAACHWSEVARTEFAALGMPGGQADALAVHARALLHKKRWSAAIVKARRALDLAEVNGFEGMRDHPLNTLAQAADEQAATTGYRTDLDEAVCWIRRCLELEPAARPRMLSNRRLLTMLVTHFRALGRTAEAIDAQRRLVAAVASDHGSRDVLTVRPRLELVRFLGEMGETSRARQEVNDILVGYPREELPLGSPLRGDAWLALAELHGKEGDIDGAMQTLAEREDELIAAASEVSGLCSRQDGVRLLSDAGRWAEALATQRDIVDRLTDTVGADARETREARENRNALEWQICCNEAWTSIEAEDNAGALARLDRWFAERPADGVNDLHRHLSYKVRRAACLSRMGDQHAETWLRLAHREAVVEFGRAAWVSRMALAERAYDRRRAGDRFVEISYLKELHGIEISQLGEASDDAIGSLQQLAQAHAVTGNPEGAARCAARAIELCVARRGEDDPVTREVREGVRDLLPVDARPSFERPDYVGWSASDLQADQPSATTT